ncbi:ribosomal protein S5 domain 2-type protein [Lipomyces tetrasporus]|uniref:Ribosomal protein S5 domain 2-type protein n=1 Tax=Lipomyces tetrasporus TaxID=54092 RepID=A0AAD7QYL6_9ASCO|nr:ribosomal protein S5 domain 2-type protein [Lipomyces tetrasporus]KAJ8103857.1 ribosomal protein S5 domain 2-type protein [Lipomyces tetrasporus]
MTVLGPAQRSPATATTAFLYRVDGSASWTVGTAHIIVSVSGPMEVNKRDELPDIATLEIVVRPDVGVASTREQFLQDRIRRVVGPVIALELHPRTLIQIVVQIVQSGDTKTLNTIALSASINATYMALLDAGVPVRSTVSATSIVCYGTSSIQGGLTTGVLIDPTRPELEKIEKDITSVHTIAYELKGGQIERLLLSESVGTFTEDEVFECYDTAAKVCEETNGTMREAVTKSVQQKGGWRD